MNNRWLLSSSVAAVALMTGTQALAQQGQEFDVRGLPLLFTGAGTGTGNTVGSFRDYANVITIDGTQIDARITLTGLTGATLQTFDSTANPYAETNHFQPNLNITAAGGHANFRVDFFVNGQPVTLRNFYVNTYDLDASGGSANGRQYTDFTGFASYTVSNATKVAVQGNGGSTRFVTTIGGNLNYATGSDEFNTIRARVLYLSASSITVAVGDTSGTGVAYFGLDFSIGYAFNNAQADTVAPVVTAGQSFSYQENRPANAVVATVAATDQYGVTAFRFAATGTTTSADGYYTIDGAGAVRLTAAGAAAGAPTNDFETLPNAFTYAVQAADAAGNWSAAQNVTFAVTDVSETVITGPGGVAGAGSSAVSVNENQTGAATLSASKPVTWSITGGADAARFAINASTGVVTFLSPPDFELPSDSDANNSYLLVVTADDGAGSVVSQTVTVTVLDVAEAPLAFAGTNDTSNGNPSYLFTYHENRTAGAVLGTVGAGGGTGPYVFGITGGNANGWYAIDAGTGAITLTAAGAASLANDFEAAPNTQTLTIQARDAASATVTIATTLNETDLDDTAPVITGPGGVAGAATATVSVDENGTAVTTLTAGEPVTWSIVGGTDATRFTIDPSTGVVTFLTAPDYEAPTDSDADNSYVLVVRAQDVAGNASTQAIAVTVRDLDEIAPVVTGPAGGAVSVPENSTAVATLTASEGVTWAIAGGPDAARFAISPGGAVSFVTPPDFEAPTDADGDNVYLVTIRATDAAGNISTRPLTVTVTNIADTAPVITGPSGGAGATSAALSRNEGTTAVTTLSASKPVTWSLAGGSDAARFAIDATTGAVTFLTAPDFEAPTDSDANNSYVLIVRATDADGLASTQTLTVTILNIDDTAPVITGPSGAPGAASSARSVNEGTVAVATLAANEAVTWTITGGVDAGRFTINPNTGALSFVTAPDFEMPADADGDNGYQLTVTATDAAGNASVQAVFVTVLDLDDTAPVIGAPASVVTVDENQTAVATATASEPATWSIAGGADAARFAINPTTGAITFVTAPDFETPTDAGADNSYQLVIAATDASGNAGTRTVTVTVRDLDEAAPVIGGTATTVSVAEGQTAVATLTADEPVTWSVTGGADASRFAISPGGALTFVTAPDYEAPADANGDNVYQLIVTATDASGNASMRTVTVTVLDRDDTAPVIVGPGGSPGAASATVSVNEGQTAATTLTAGEAVTWSISGGADAARLAIDAATGAITFVTIPDFEAPADADRDNNYQLIVTATDAAGNASVQALTVRVLDIDDTAPAITGPGGGAGAASSTVSVNEGQTAAVTLTAGEAVSWSITGGPDAARFAIDPATGAVTFQTAPDFEAPTDADGDNSYQLTVTATDASGNASSQAVVVRVLDVDDSAPVITGPGGGAGAAGSAVSVNEGVDAVTTLTASETVSWTITGGADAARFGIDPATGAIRFLGTTDYEAPGDADGNNVYLLTVTATDGAGNRALQTLTVTVLDVDDAAPVIGGGSGTASASVREGEVAVTTFVASEAVTWSIGGGADAARFVIDPATGALRFAVAPDFEQPADTGADNVYDLIVRATDANGNAGTLAVTVTVTDVDDSAPVIAGGNGPAAFTVAEGTAAIATLAASEPVSWTIEGGADAARFAIDAGSGAISFRTVPDFEAPADSDADNVYAFTVRATDASGNIASRPVTVTVTDIDDAAPVIGTPDGPGSPATPLVVIEGQTVVATLSASETVSWAIAPGEDGARFVLDPTTGALTFAAMPDFEKPGDADGNNVYQVTVTATDASGNVARATLSVRVADRDDTAPTIGGTGAAAGAGSAEIGVAEGTMAVTTLTAGEAVTWSLAGGADAGRFVLDATTGALAFAAATDFENPADADRDNAYLVRVRAVDAAGNEAFQLLTVRVADRDEIGARLAEIGGRLRTGLRDYAVHSLSDMLSFNENLVGRGASECGAPIKPWSGALNGDEKSQEARLAWAGALNGCNRPVAIFMDAGVSSSRVAGDWTTRGLASLRVEHRLTPGTTVGVALMGSSARDNQPGFSAGTIADRSLQVNGYLRARLPGTLRAGAFGGFGRSWYDFSFVDDGLVVAGKVRGQRHVYGAMVSGDLPLGSLLFTTDAIFSRAVERLGNAKLAARYAGESRDGIRLPLGSVDISRLSVPVSARFAILGGRGPDGRAATVAVSSGVLCEDSAAATAGWTCGYQLGGKVATVSRERSRVYLDYRYESVDTTRRSLIGMGYAYRFGRPLELGVDLNRGTASSRGKDYRAMVGLKFVP